MHAEMEMEQTLLPVNTIHQDENNHFTHQKEAETGEGQVGPTEVLTEVPPSQPKQTIYRVSFALAYGILLGLVATLTAILLPTEISFYEPQYAALANGMLIFVSCAFQGLAPVIGSISDRYNSRRPLILIGAIVITVGLVGLLLSVSSGDRSQASFFFFCVSYLILSAGYAFLSVSFAGLVADFGTLLPEKVGTISGIWSLFQIIGSALGYIMQGVVLPVSRDNHEFYYFLIGLVIISNICLLHFLPRKMLKVETTEENSNTTQEQDDSLPCHTSMFLTLSEWYSSSLYSSFRYVILSRFLFYAGLGVFSAMILYFFEDQTNAGKNANAMMTYVAMISLVSSLLAVWPAGFLSDKFGSGIVAALGSILMSIFLGTMSFQQNVTIIMLLVPIYGIAQQGYNVGDLSMVIQSIPNEKTKARDMGAWNAISAFGQALGSALSSSMISFFHEDRNIGTSPSSSGNFSPSSSSSVDAGSNGGDLQTRVPYKRQGYELVFLSASVMMLISCGVLCIASSRLQAKLQAKSDQYNEV